MFCCVSRKSESIVMKHELSELICKSLFAEAFFGFQSSNKLIYMMIQWINNLEITSILNRGFNLMKQGWWMLWRIYQKLFVQLQIYPWKYSIIEKTKWNFLSSWELLTKQTKNLSPAPEKSRNLAQRRVKTRNYDLKLHNFDRVKIFSWETDRNVDV